MIRRFAVLLLFLLLAGLARTLATGGQAAVAADTQQETLYPIASETPSLEPSPYLEPGSPTPSFTVSVHSPTPSATLGPSSTLKPGQTLQPSLTPTPTTEQTLGTTPVETATSAVSATSGRDLFGTEDAEIAGARVTPPASETPGPSPTGSPSITPTATPKPPEGFLFDPSWFLGGLVGVVVVLAAGWLINRIRRSGEFG